MDKEEAMKILKDFHDKAALFSVRTALEALHPELAESEDEKIKKGLIEFINEYGDKFFSTLSKGYAIAWLEKQGKRDARYENLEELLEADDIYQMAMNEAMVEEAKTKAINALSGLQISKLLSLEKQREQDNWAEELNTKIKKLHEQCLEIIRKYVSPQKPTIIWHNIDEKPEEMKELFCEWESDDATWHDVAFYDEESHTFRHAKMPINVTKWVYWVYVDELLEKQGEQKKDICDGCNNVKGCVICVDGSEKVKIEEERIKPKFKVGDLIKHNKANLICKIISVNSGSYYVKNIETNGKIELFNAEQNFHLWTIHDAKPGDVLVDVYGNIGIYQKHDAFDWRSYCSLGCNGGFRKFIIIHEIEGTSPATKEQRETLFKAMSEEGYEWNPDKEE